MNNVMGIDPGSEKSASIMKKCYYSSMTIPMDYLEFEGKVSM